MKLLISIVVNNKIIKLFFRTLLLSLALGSPGLLQASLFDKGFEYIYSLSKNDFTVVHVDRSLQVSANKLTFTSHAYPVGFASLFVSDTITEQSIINFKNGKILPLSYSYVKQADEIKKQFHIRFDRITNTVTDSRVRKPFKLTADTYDALSFQLALAKALTSPQPKLTFTLVDNKRTKIYQLEAQGEEQLETDAGKFDTRKFSYFDEIKKRRVIIWCAKQLDHLPVQIRRIDQDGDYADLKLISLKPRAQTDSGENDNNF